MKKQILKLMQNTWGLLIFALLSGSAYYVVILKFILLHTAVGGGLLGFFLLPLIICGAALALIKIIRQCFDNERENAVITVFILHVIFIAVAVVYLISMLQ